MRATGCIDTGTAAGHLLGAYAKQGRGNRRRSRRIADAHLAKDQKIGLCCGSACDRAPAAVKGESDFLRLKRLFLAEVPAAPARLVGDDVRDRLFGERPGVDDLET